MSGMPFLLFVQSLFQFGTKEGKREGYYREKNYLDMSFVEAVTGCTFACICYTVFRMFSCLQINWQPFYLHQLLNFHSFDWLIEFFFKPRARVLTTKWNRSNHCLVFPLCCFIIEFVTLKPSVGYKLTGLPSLERWD